MFASINTKLYYTPIRIILIGVLLTGLTSCSSTKPIQTHQITHYGQHESHAEKLALMITCNDSLKSHKNHVCFTEYFTSQISYLHTKNKHLSAQEKQKVIERAAELAEVFKKQKNIAQQCIDAHILETTLSQSLLSMMNKEQTVDTGPSMCVEREKAKTTILKSKQPE